MQLRHAFMCKTSGLETFKQCKAGHGFTKAVIQKLSSMSTVEKCNFTTAFTLWYEKLPPARTSNTKLVESGYDVGEFR
ncbi:hypothetical protein PAEPH01_2938 [Pancytospora epiphaga]|nr:hypothetical protein PAEPH01_2938 [Pancytospora epiphaga]